MRIRFPTPLKPQAAIRLQNRLAPLVNATGKPPKRLEHVVGCDATYVHGTTIAAAVAVSYEGLAIRGLRTVQEPTTFPYIPGLLAFREAPAVLHAIRALRSKSYVCLVDGHGLAHPRKFGLACFVGLALDRPTIGVAKSLLYGSVQGERVVDGDGSPMAELISLPGSGKTIYVSVGHKISLESAVQVVKHCLTPQGPLPIRLAHREVTRRRWQTKRSSPVS